jgi:hypothetical protein
MSATATEPTATVTLPVWTLQDLRVRALATAALVALDLARREAYWSSPEGRAASDRMWCGEQDAASDRLDALRARIADEQATAGALAAAITAAGYQPLAPSMDHAAGGVLWVALEVLDAPADLAAAIAARIGSATESPAQRLRDYLAGKF